MAALRAQSLVAGSTSARGPTLVCRKRVPVKSACAGNRSSSAFFLKDRLCVRQKQTASKGDLVRASCRASNSSLESEGTPLQNNVDLSDIVLNSSDPDLVEMASKRSQKSSNDSATHPPKFSTLRAFGEGGSGVMSGLEGSVIELLAANIEATADLRRFETLSGRLAMMAFFVAIGVEVVTGNSVFKGIDVKELGQFAALAGVATISAAGFAFAWRARSDVASSLSKGALKLVDAALDNVIDGLFYDEEEKFKQ